MIHSSLQRPEEYNTSRFYMWRCVVAMAHADGLIHEAETEYLTRIFDNMRKRAGLPEDHHKRLHEDLDNPQDVADLLPYINDPEYRGQVVYFARLLAYKDGELHPSEEQLLSKLHAQAIEGVDMNAVKEDVHRNVSQDLIIHEVKMDSQRPQDGLFGLIDQMAVHFGIDLMDE